MSDESRVRSASQVLLPLFEVIQLPADLSVELSLSPVEVGLLLGGEESIIEGVSLEGASLPEHPFEASDLTWRQAAIESASVNATLLITEVIVDAEVDWVGVELLKDA
jgi:hypothetical protein